VSGAIQKSLLACGLLLLLLTALPAHAAVTYVNAGTAYQTASGTETSSAASVPASIVANNILIAWVCAYNGSANTAVTITVPSGWTALDSGSTADPGRGNSFWACGASWRLATGTESASYSWTFNIAVNSTIEILQYTGNATSTPIDAHALTNPSATQATSATTPTVSATSGDLLLSFDGASLFSSPTQVISAPGAPTTERVNVHGSGAPTWIDPAEDLVDEAISSTGTTTSRTFTTTGSSAWSTATIAIKPGAGTPTAGKGVFWVF
jgi:hypothetical protein